MFNKLFWKSYFGDKDRLRFMAIFGLILAIVIALFSVPLAIGMICGYTFSDPFTYYVFFYRKIV
jgi:hypothetical protein